MKRLLSLGILALSALSPVQAQVAAHCAAAPTLEGLIDDMTAQNLGGLVGFWDSGQTQVSLLLANANQQASESLNATQGAEAAADLRDMVARIQMDYDLPLPMGGPLLPTLRPKTADVQAIEDGLARLQRLEAWVDVPFNLELEPDLGIDLAEFRALWAQSRAYAGDQAALAYVRDNDLIVPRAIRMPERFRPDRLAMNQSAEDLLAAVLTGEVTWVAAENTVWGWLRQGDRIRAQGFALALKDELLLLRQDFVGGRPNFEALEPFSGYFTSWQRWEDMAARLLLMLGQRSEVPASFFHQTLTLGLGETEPNIAALDASQLFAAWHNSGYGVAARADTVLASQREPADIRRAQDMYAFFQVLVRGDALGQAHLMRLLEDAESGPNARWIGGPLLMEAFFDLGLEAEALRAAAVAAKAETGLSSPYSYVTPLIRIGEIEQARDVLAIFHREACSRVALRSGRAYSWIEWLPLTAATDWRVPVSRFDGI